MSSREHYEEVNNMTGKNRPTLNIAKARKGSVGEGWWILDPTYGIHIIHWTATEKEAKDWCKGKGYKFLTGYEY